MWTCAQVIDNCPPDLACTGANKCTRRACVCDAVRLLVEVTRILLEPAAVFADVDHCVARFVEPFQEQDGWKTLNER